MLDQVDRRFAKSRVDRLAIDSRSSRSKFFKVELIVLWSTNRHLILTCLRIIIVDDTTQVSAIRFGHLCTLQYWRVDTIRDASLPKIKKKISTRRSTVRSHAKKYFSLYVQTNSNLLKQIKNLFKQIGNLFEHIVNLFKQIVILFKQNMPIC